MAGRQVSLSTTTTDTISNKNKKEIDQKKKDNYSKNDYNYFNPLMEITPYSFNFLNNII